MEPAPLSLWFTSSSSESNSVEDPGPSDCRERRRGQAGVPEESLLPSAVSRGLVGREEGGWGIVGLPSLTHLHN